MRASMGNHHSNHSSSSPVDNRINALPEHLLCRILSFLPTKTVVQTCLVAKKWKNLWRSVPCLDLDCTLFPSPKAFNNFIEPLIHELLCYESYDNASSSFDLEELYLFCPTNSGDISIDSCIAFAGANNVQVIEIAINWCSYTQLSNIFTFSSLRVLILKSESDLPTDVRIRLPSTSLIWLPFLETLHLDNLLLEDIEPIFSRCPVLETLVLECCVFKHSRDLNIFCPQLKNLSFTEKLCFSGLNTINISTPNLRSFSVDFFVLGRICFTYNHILSLSNACVNASIYTIPLPNCMSLIQLIKDVGQHVESLSLSVYKPLIYQWKEGFHIPEYADLYFCNLKRLELTTSFHNGEYLFLYTLLKHAPNLEYLILEDDYSEPQVEAGSTEADQPSLQWIDFVLAHLKSVEVQNFRGCENGVKFVKFLLENAVALERVQIEYNEYYKDQIEMMIIGKDLETHPRASSSIAIFSCQ